MSEQLPSFREVLQVVKGQSDHKIFEISADGSVSCHGYTVDEVVMLLEAYRTHLAEVARMMTGIQSEQDAVRYTPGDPYTPVGPEDV